MKGNHIRARRKRLIKTNSPCYYTTLEERKFFTDEVLGGILQYRVRWSCILKMRPKSEIGKGYYEYTFRDFCGVPITSVISKDIWHSSGNLHTEEHRRENFLSLVGSIENIREYARKLRSRS